MRSSDEGDDRSGSDDRSEHSHSSYSSSGQDSSSGSSSDSDAIVISARSRIVISPRRHVSAATWESFGRQLDSRHGLTGAAEQLLSGVGALQRAQSRTTGRSGSGRSPRRATDDNGGGRSPRRTAAAAGKRRSDSRDRVASNAATATSSNVGAGQNVSTARRDASPRKSKCNSDVSRHAATRHTPTLDPTLLASAAPIGRTRPAPVANAHSSRKPATSRSDSHRVRDKQHSSHSSDNSNSSSSSDIELEAHARRSERLAVVLPPAPEHIRRLERPNSLASSESEEKSDTSEDSASDRYTRQVARVTNAGAAKTQRQHTLRSAEAIGATRTSTSRTHGSPRSNSRKSAANASTSKSKTPVASAPGAKANAKTTAKPTMTTVNERRTCSSRTAAASNSSSNASSGSSSSLPHSSRPTVAAADKRYASFMSDNSFDDAAAAVLPSPKEEIEQLKQTLQNLATHDAAAQKRSSSDNTRLVPSSHRMVDNDPTSTASKAHRPVEHVRVATAAVASPSSAAEQLRFGEYVAQQQQQPFMNGSVDAAAPYRKSSFAKQQSDSNASHHTSFDATTLESKLREAREAINPTGNASRPKSFSIATSSALHGELPPRSSLLNHNMYGQGPAMTGGSGQGSAYLSNAYNGSAANGAGRMGMAHGGAAAGGSDGSGAQGSRAVLSALKALQDKIRRLEEERESLTQQLSDERVKARKREAELTSSEKKFAYELGQSKESARAAYDAVRAKCEELKIELVRADERRKSAESEVEHFEALVQTYGTKSDDLEAQLETVEAQRAQLQADLEHVTTTSKQETQELAARVETLETQCAANQKELEHLDAQLTHESSTHAESRTRLHDAEQTIASLSQLNEQLVARAREATEIANNATKQSRKLQTQQRVPTASKTTAASRASAAAATSSRSASLAARRAGSSAATTGPSNGRLRGAAGSAAATSTTRGLKKRTGGTAAGGESAGLSKKPTRKSKARDNAAPLGANNMELLRDANLGKDIPFLLGTSPNQSFSLIGSVQNALRQCDTTYVTPNTLSPAPIRIPTATSTTTRGRRTPKTRHTKASKHNTSAGVSASMLGVAPLPPPSSDAAAAAVTYEPSTLVGDRTQSAMAADKPRTGLRDIVVPPPAPPAPVSAHINPMQTQIMEDLAAALQVAETEFAALNARYKDTVARMQADSRGGSSDSSTQLSSALGSLLDELEAKSTQVHRLQHVFQQAATSSINPLRRTVHSPAAVRRKTASLRLLHEYRQLERDARVSPHYLQQQQQASSSVFFGDHAMY